VDFQAVNSVDADRLRRRVVRELNRQGYHLRSTSFYRNGEAEKDFVRSRHAWQRKARLDEELTFIRLRGRKLIADFADGTDVIPEAINPELIPVDSDTRDADLFRFACLLWSVPTSRGYGRRMRYIVRDRQNGKLLGLIALGDPVFNLTARDEWIGWKSTDREQRLVNVMDAYVLGAVPPYNQLLCGKLVAALATSKEITRRFRHKYAKSRGIISGSEKHASLALLTTTSALGRSSLYSRLRLPDGVQFLPVGMTKGYGHFHLPNRVVEQLKEFMSQRGHPYADGHQFGDGPNWRLRLLREAFRALDIDEEVLKHGITREVYVAPLAMNARSFLLGNSKRLRMVNWHTHEIADYCRQRWIIPRAQRDSAYQHVSRASIIDQITEGSWRVRRVLLRN
jgi:hypothetical protein